MSRRRGRRVLGSAREAAMVQLPIKRTIDRIPGGMMIVPLFFGAIIRTWAPGVPTFFGSFTGALFTGALTILAVFYVCMGSTIEFNATPSIIKKGGALFAAKVASAIIVGIVLGRRLGEAPVPNGGLAGISTLAVVAAMNDTNGGLYMALMGQFGAPRDVAAYTIMSIESGPFLTMVTLGVAGLSAFPWQALVGAILPLAVGMLIGNLDREMRAFLAAANPVYKPAAASATVLVATSVVITAILVPIVTAWWYRRVSSRAAGRAAAPAVAAGAPAGTTSLRS